MTSAIPTADTGYGSPYIDTLIFGYKWDPAPATPLKYYFGSGSGHPAWTQTEKDAFRQALDLYESVTNLHFAETADKSQANFVWEKWTGSQLGSSNILGEHYFPIGHGFGNLQIEGHFNYQQTKSWSQLQQGGDGFVTIIHELGHGMGLAHPHADGPGDEHFPGVNDAFETGSYGLNQGIWTTMSYNVGWSSRPSPSYAYGAQGTLMAFDIAALQELYGVNTTFHVGDDVYQLDTTNGTGTFWACIWDAGGTDTLSNAGATLACTIDLRAATLMANDPNAGGFVSAAAGIVGGFTIAHDVVIENAIGGNGSDTIVGNNADNQLEGGAGNDTINGQGGVDLMIGGAGNDSYVVDNVDDKIQELDGEGIDSITASIDYALPDFVENLKLTASVALVGNTANNRLTGNGLDNTFDGKDGADIMSGGGGNDVYEVDNSSDQVVEASTGGTDDTVNSSANYVLASYVENLVLTGSDLIDGTGNSSANKITGNDAANILDGKGGADIMIGGDGDDTYLVDSASDKITEDFDKGTDTVKASSSYTLSDNLENLILLGLVVAGNGNGDDNDITGNSAANTIDGKAGADEMAGMAGNDTYFVDDGGDDVVEALGGGTDTIKTALDFTLFDNVENLILLGTDDIDGTGNALNNALTGNAGKNRLDGGIGNDTMTGGLGDDTYVVDSATDKIVETSTGGVDTVEASASYTLASYIENLTLTGLTAIKGTGSSVANIITGNDAANILDGKAGADTLIGGDGDDTFILDNPGDTVIEDKDHGTDTIKSSVTHTLEPNVENLILTGTAAISGTGNELDNALTGNNAANVLDGGTGADEMTGLKGNDTYIVDDLGDVVSEAASGGTDTIKASVSHTLEANVERLTLTGTDPIDGVGNTLANIIIGNDGANKLSGLGGNDTLQGGLGQDTLVGGAGSDKLSGGGDADTFHFDALAEKGDTFTDFVSDIDKIEIAAAGFAGAVAGNVHFVQANTPHAADGNASFLFDMDASRLYWDDDGTGAHAAQLLATLTGVHSLAATDLVIV